MLDWAMARPEFKTQLFRFVDVFPALADNDDVAAPPGRVLRRASRCPRVLDLGVDVAAHVPFGRTIEAARRPPQHHAHGRAVHRRSDRGRGGRGPASAVAIGLRRHRRPARREDDRRRARPTGTRPGSTSCVARRSPQRPRTGRPTITSNATTSARSRASTSASSRPRSPPTTSRSTRRVGLEHAKARIRPLLRLAREHGAFVHFDMEHYDAKDLTLQLFRELLTEPEHRRHRGRHRRAGVPEVDSRDDLADLIAFSSRPTHADHDPLGEGRVLGHRDGARRVPRAGRFRSTRTRPRPTPTTSVASGCCTITTARCAPRSGRTTCGRSPTRSRTPEPKGIPDTGFEVQMLYGMAEPMQAAVRRSGLRLRVYAPVGELVPGMAYLVRRLLENTSNESFVRHRFVEDRRARPSCSPRPTSTRCPAHDREPDIERPTTDPARPTPYAPEPVSEWRRSDGPSVVRGRRRHRWIGTGARRARVGGR